MKYYKIRPQVPASLGDDTVFEEVDGLRKLRYAHLVFHAWPDSLIKRAMIYAVDEELKRRLEDVGATGIAFRDCKISKDEQFSIAEPGRSGELPPFYEMLVTGEPFHDDLGREGKVLVVSERIRQLLAASRLSSECEIEHA